MFTKILIANRGEIARRILRACRDLGIRAAVVHSEADREAAFVQEADQAIGLEGSSPAGTYLNVPALLAAAERCGVQAIHPGYGFLSEQAGFARACESAGFAFIGPSPETLAAAGDKAQARRLASSLAIPVVPGFDESAKNGQVLEAAAQCLGFPLLVKARAGGGGRGIRTVAGTEDLPAALAEARAEAHGAFQDDRLFLEKLLSPARHVEIQFLGDGAGRVVHLHERECSIQRRRQKLIEESPAPGLDPRLLSSMADAAVRIALAAGYRGAGTAEFLVDADGHFYFLEINARIQVEHPVTEIVTRIDLVAWQIRLAAGEALTLEQSDLERRGHAIECRVCAEDPAKNFWPCTGRIRQLHLPQSPGIRCDSGVIGGEEITPLYDSLLLKLVASGSTRAEALARMSRALAETVVLGVQTNIDFLGQVIRSQAFQQGALRTDFLDLHFRGWKPEPALSDQEILALAAFELLGSPQPSGRTERPAGSDDLDPWSRLGRWRNLP